MSDLQKKLNKVISDIEKNLKNKEDLDNVRQEKEDAENIDDPNVSLD